MNYHIYIHNREKQEEKRADVDEIELLREHFNEADAILKIRHKVEYCKCRKCGEVDASQLTLFANFVSEHEFICEVNDYIFLYKCLK